MTVRKVRKPKQNASRRRRRDTIVFTERFVSIVWAEFCNRVRTPRATSQERAAVVFAECCEATTFAILRRVASQRGVRAPRQWSAKVSGKTAKQIRQLCVTTPFTAAMCGAAFEYLVDCEPTRTANGWVLARSGKRRAEGVYFTPSDLAKVVCASAMKPLLERVTTEAQLTQVRIVDPAMGAAAFLVEAFRLLRAHGRKIGLSEGESARVALQCMHGVDRDPRAVAIGWGVLWLEASDSRLPHSSGKNRFKVGDALLGTHPLCATSLKHVHGNRQLHLALHSDTIASQQSCGKGRGAGRAFDWTKEFPGIFSHQDPRGKRGFDLVIGNPPWEKVKAHRKEWERLRAATGRSCESWEDFRSRSQRYAQLLRGEGVFSLQSVVVDGKTRQGDGDLYKYFLERMIRLVCADGRVAAVVPAAFYQSEGATGLRQAMFSEGMVESLVSCWNTDRMFPIHSMFKYTILIWKRGRAGGVRNAVFGVTGTSIIEDTDKLMHSGVRLTAAWLRSVSGNLLAVPEVRSKADVRLFTLIHKAHPQLSAKHPQWNVSFARELDMTNDRKLFLDRQALSRRHARPVGSNWAASDGTVYLPLYEGRLIHQFDFCAKAYVSGTGRAAKWEPILGSAKTISPQFWVAASQKHRGVKGQAVFCDVTGQANERTVLSSVIPFDATCGNKVPRVCFDSADARLPYLWTALANSFVVDWIMRRRVSTTINFFHWRLVPLPRLSPDDPVGEQLWTTAAALHGITTESRAEVISLLQRYGREISLPGDYAERGRLRAKLDVLVARAYGLKWADMARILEDFRLIDRRQPALAGETRSSITRDAICAEWFRNEPRNVPGATAEDRYRRAIALGALPYIPSEQAAATPTNMRSVNGAARA